MTNDAAVLTPAGPFLRYVQHGKIQHLKQAVIRGEYSLGFGHFPKLTVKAFNGVCRINQSTELLWELEVGT